MVRPCHFICSKDCFARPFGGGVASDRLFEEANVSLTAPPALATYLGLAILLTIVLVLATGLLSPSRPSAAKARPYESGISEPIAPQARWHVRFALVGLLLLLFD